MTIEPGAGADRRLAGAGLTVLVHAGLILGCHLARQPAPAQPDSLEPAIQWLQLPAPAPRIDSPAAPAPAQTSRRAAPAAASRPSTRPVADAPTAPTAPPPQQQTAAQAPPPPPAAPSVDSILDNARRSAGDIERALRKERLPTIVAPPDSPEIRMRERMGEAHQLAPPRSWEAPRVEELLNQTGDGARRTRVITGRGTYCITERSPVTIIDMIEKHGKQRFTNCPQHETPAKAQEWRTARD